MPSAFLSRSALMLRTTSLAAGLFAFSSQASQAAMVITPPSEPKVITASKPDLGIMAQVGDEAISSYDVDNRMKFIIATANLANTPDVIEHVRPQVIRSLVDERLELQEAKKNDIKVTEQDIDQAIGSIEQQRSMPPGTIGKMLERDGVPIETFRNQIRAQLSWNHLLSKKVRPQVTVSDAEIKLANDKMVAMPVKKAPAAEVPKEQQEYKIAVISIPVDKPSREKEVSTLSEKLVKALHNGASFEELSRQFSSAAANAGGKVEAFWVGLEQVDPMVARALSPLKTGDVTPPVRTSEGYNIIKIYETRNAPTAKNSKAKKPVAPAVHEEPVNVREVALNLRPDATVRDKGIMRKIGEAVARNPGKCGDDFVPQAKGMENYNVRVTEVQQMPSELPGELRSLIEPLKVGDVAQPMVLENGVRIYMRCEKKADQDDGKPTHDQIYGLLMQHKMELEAQKYLRNLRRETFIDIR